MTNDNLKPDTDLMRKVKSLSGLAYMAERALQVSTSDNVDDATADAAYLEYWQHLDAIAATLVELLQIDGLTARKMAAHKMSEVTALISKMAA